MSKGTVASITSQCDVCISGLGFDLPEFPIPIADMGVPEDVRHRLRSTGQEFTYRSEGSSTDLAIGAARAALATAGIAASDISLVITAPTLLTGYGLEIPAVAIRAMLGLENAMCLNVAQGCVGILAAIRLAAEFLRADDSRGNVLIVTSCKGSSLTDAFTHGGFYWGDGGAAAVLSRESNKGLIAEAYAEVSSHDNWGAMRIPFGDSSNYWTFDPTTDFKVSVNFSNPRQQADYIAGEQARCTSIISALLSEAEIVADDIDGVFLPSVGKKRMPFLLAEFPGLEEKVRSDFRFPHLGGVDVLLFLDKWLTAEPPKRNGWFVALTPAFTAQWGGVLFRWKI